MLCLLNISKIFTNAPSRQCRIANFFKLVTHNYSGAQLISMFLHMLQDNVSIKLNVIDIIP